MSKVYLKAGIAGLVMMLGIASAQARPIGAAEIPDHMPPLNIKNYAQGGTVEINLANGVTEDFDRSDYPDMREDMLTCTVSQTVSTLGDAFGNFIQLNRYRELAGEAEANAPKLSLGWRRDGRSESIFLPLNANVDATELGNAKIVTGKAIRYIPESRSYERVSFKIISAGNKTRLEINSNQMQSFGCALRY